MLATREQEILAFVAAYIGKHQHAPTLIEIGQAVGLRAKSSTHGYVRTLERKGYVAKAPGWRGLRLTNKAERHLASLPFAGRIVAGSPLEPVPEQSEISLVDLLLGDGRYVLQIKGDSMMEAGILEGDYIIVQPAIDVRSGDIAVVLIDGFETTLKRIRRRGRLIELIPANASLRSITYAAERIEIQGIVAGQFRRYGR